MKKSRKRNRFIVNLRINEIRQIGAVANRTYREANMARKNKILNIGDKAPLFTLTSVQRETVSLESYLSQQPVILAFFRGTW